jgi:nucleoside-diphosphate-sugar epimerase
MRVALTGATGFLGRNLLFEIVKRHLGALDRLEVLVLGRSRGEVPLGQRIRAIVLGDGLDYLGLTGGGPPDMIEGILRAITPVPLDLAVCRRERVGGEQARR